MKRIVQHSKPTINEQDGLRVGEVVLSGRLADYSQVSEFEKELASYVGQKSGVATNSGTNALFLALLSLQETYDGKSKKDEVIIPSFCCIALLNAINAARLSPKIVDINENDYNISLNEIKKIINKNTIAIIAPHMFGDPVKNIEDIVDLGIEVIEDCALSVGAGIKGKKLGSFSDVSVFSFAATKMMTTGHGGMVLSSSEKIIKKLKDCMHYDNRRGYSPSFNFRMTDFQAALGRSQLSRLEGFIEKRKQIAKRYNEGFKYCRDMKVPKRSKESLYFRYILHLEDANKFIKKIAKEGISCAKPVFKPLHRYFGLDKKNFPNTEKAYKECVSVPIYPSMDEDKISYVIDKINSIR